MDRPSHDRGLLRDDALESAAPPDRGVDDLLRWIEDVLLAQAGAGWGDVRPTWLDVAQVLQLRSDLVVPVFRVMQLTGGEVIDARDLLARDGDAFMAVAVLAGLISSAPV